MRPVLLDICRLVTCTVAVLNSSVRQAVEVLGDSGVI